MFAKTWFHYIYNNSLPPNWSIEELYVFWNTNFEKPIQLHWVDNRKANVWKLPQQKGTCGQHVTRFLIGL